MFGRASEEIEHLTQLGVKVEIIPGVTSASAVAAELGFSLTRKGVADSVWFVTGHLGATCVKADMVGRVTIVIYMGLSELDGLLERLIAEGARRDVAAVAVQTIGLETEKIVWGNVSSLAQKVRKAELHSATLVVIGDVVKEGRGWNG